MLHNEILKSRYILKVQCASHTFCLKSLVWFLNLSLNGVSEAPTYLLDLLLLSLETFVSYTILGVRIYCPIDIDFELQNIPKYSKSVCCVTI